jgi:hypothetical protein
MGMAIGAGALAWLIATGMLASMGSAVDAVLTLIVVVTTLVPAGLLAGTYMLAAWGYGGVVSNLGAPRRARSDGGHDANSGRGGDSSGVVRLGLGVAVLLLLSHVLGQVGLLGAVWGGAGSGAARVGGGVVAWIAVAVGVALAARDAWRMWRARAARSGDVRNEGTRGGAVFVARIAIGAVIVLVLAVMASAVASPPGWLWDSEGGGYDAISYHLRLPQEWLGSGVLAPTEHNVYSFLPGFVEAAFMHIGAMAMGARGVEASVSAGGSGAWGMLAREGLAMHASQTLAAMLTLGAAWSSGGLARRVCRGSEGSRACTSSTPGRCDMAGAGWIAAIVVLTCGWVVVTGTLAFNESAMLLMGGSALIVAMDAGISARRWAMAGVLVGGACGAKATAMFMFGAPCALVMLVSVVRAWRSASDVKRSVLLQRVAMAVISGGATGCVMLTPWMVRNAMLCGNPVFPYMTDVFGAAHWTAEQVARFRGAHHFGGGWGERLSMLVGASTTGARGSATWTMDTHRGLSHPQWGVLGIVFALATVAALARVRTHKVAAMLAGVLIVQFGAWLTLTHIQSRFLLPIVVPGAAMVALAWSGWRDIRRGVVATAAVSLVLAAQATMLVRVWTTQRNGEPGAMIVPGVRSLVGVRSAGGAGAIAETFLDRAEAIMNARDAEWARHTRDGGRDRLYMLGGATPMYFIGDVVYHTTWDTSPLGEAVRAYGDDPAAWTRAIREEGITHVLIDLREIGRLGMSGDVDAHGERRGWYDPDVTTKRAIAWGGALTPVRVWEEQGLGLFALPVEDDRGTPGGGGG